MNITIKCYRNIFIFLFLGIIHMNIYYHGTKMNFIAMGEIVAFAIFVYGLYFKKWTISKECGIIFLLCFIPLCILSTIQFFYVRDFIVIKTLIHRLLFIISSFVIVKMISIENFMMSLRWWMIINIFVILVMFFLGTIETIDPYSYSYGSIGISYMGVTFPFNIGFFGDDFFRCGGLFGHPNSYGILSSIAFIGVVLSKCSFKVKALWGLFFMIAFAINESRGSILMVGVYFLINRFLKTKISIKNLIYNVLTISLIASVFASLAYIRDDTGADFTAGRTELLSIIYQKFDGELDVVKLFGVGFGNVTNYLMTNFSDVIAFDNGYLYTIIELGWLGGLVFFIFMLITFCYSCKITSMPISEYFPFFIAFCVHAIFESDFVGDKYMYWMIFFFYMVKNKYRPTNT